MNVVYSEMTVVPGNPLEVIRTIMNVLPRGNYFSAVVCTVCAKMFTVSPGKPSAVPLQPRPSECDVVFVKCASIRVTFAA